MAGCMKAATWRNVTDRYVNFLSKHKIYLATIMMVADHRNVIVLEPETARGCVLRH